MDKSLRRSPPRLQKVYKDLWPIIASTPHGERLPSEPELASRLGISRTTLREAISLYENQGVLYRRHGVGTFVIHSAEKIESGLEVLDTVESYARRSGLEMRCAVLKVFARLPKEEEVRILRLRPGAKVIQITRVMEVKSHPVAYMLDFLPEDLVSMDELGEGFNGSILDLFLRRGDHLLTTTSTEIRTVLAKGDLARALNVQSGEVILRFLSMVYGQGGKIVYFSEDNFLPNYFRFHVNRRVERFRLDE